MSGSNTYEIVTYLGWCGADVAHQFKSHGQYEKARAFLDRLTGAPSREAGDTSKPSGGDYYYIAREEREAFEKFMKTL